MGLKQYLWGLVGVAGILVAGCLDLSTGSEPGGSGGGKSDAGDGSSGPCWAGTKLCAGACAASDDPDYGCAATSCSPCVTPQATATCKSGECAIAACQSGRADCDGVVENGCETDTQSELSSCGACANACASGEVCSNGKCGTTCAATLTNCSGSCVDTSSSTKHCGACNSPCTPPANAFASCSGGSCAFQCGTGLSECGLSCVDLKTSPSNCGACGNACAAGVPCVSGACACGAEAQPCCPNQKCDPGFRCSSTLGALAGSVSPGCGRCGGPGQVACWSGAGEICNTGSGLIAKYETSLQVSWCVDDTPAAANLPGGLCAGNDAGGAGSCANTASSTCVGLGIGSFCLLCGAFDYFCCPGGKPTGACPAGTTCQPFNSFAYLCKK